MPALAHFADLSRTSPDVREVATTRHWLAYSICLKVGYIDLTQNCRSIWQLHDTVKICVSSTLSRLEADHEHSAIANSTRGCRRIDISWLRGTMFSGHRPLAGSKGR